MGIKMRHPDIDTYAPEVAPEGYPEAISEDQARGWEAYGWVRVTDDDVDLNSLRVAQLDELIEKAREEGREVRPASRKKEDLVKALAADRAALAAESKPEQVQGP